MIKGLDKYLESTPISCDYENSVVDSFTDDFWNENEDWTYGELCNKWIDKLYLKEVQPNKAAQIIERAYRMYYRNIKLNNK